MTVIEDKNARFICGVNGGTDLDILWYKNGRKIRFEKTPRIQDFAKDGTGATACIGIECTQPSDAGTYKCIFTDKKRNLTLETSCELIVVPRLHKTKELAAKSPPAFVRKLQCELIFFMTMRSFFRESMEGKSKISWKPKTLILLKNYKKFKVLWNFQNIQSCTRLLSFKELIRNKSCDEAAHKTEVISDFSTASQLKLSHLKLRSLLCNGSVLSAAGESI